MKALLILILATTAAFAQTVHYKSDFKNTINHWIGWNDDPQVNIKLEPTTEDGKPVLQLTGPGGWITPILTLEKPVKCTPKTMIKFKIWATDQIVCDVNILNVEEQAYYAIYFDVPAKTWVSVSRYLAKAPYKFQGKPDIPNDGLLGDHIGSFQIAVKGTKALVADVELLEADDEPEFPPEPQSVIQARIQREEERKLVQELLDKAPILDYPCLRRNGFFTYSVVSRVDANRTKSTQFGEDLEDSLLRDLVDMKRHYINSYYDFCTGTEGWELRLKQSEQTGVLLIETMFSHVYFPEASQKDLDIFHKAKTSPSLLAWYGRDEPAGSQLKPYLINKAWVSENDPIHPYTSAFHLGHVRDLLGKAMEVMIPDIYSLRPNTPKNQADIILQHAAITANVRESTAKKRVWFMTQTFSNRHQSKPGQAHFSSRYPTPLEMRLDLYACIAGGASGISFFIYNDHVPFLGGYRGEKFDYTLVDPWGNGNEVYDEIADFGKKIVPIMPSIMDALPSRDLAVECDSNNFLITQFKGEMGHVIYVVNKSLENDKAATLKFEIPADYALYNLVELAKVQDPKNVKVNLGPGYGLVFAVATQQNFNTIKNETNQRIQLDQEQLARIRQDELKKAGFNNAPTKEWLDAEMHLEKVKQTFGDLYQLLVLPDNIVKIDGGKDFEELNNTVQDLSKSYFQAKKQHANGTIPSKKSLDDLIAKINQLKDDYANKFP